MIHTDIEYVSLHFYIDFEKWELSTADTRQIKCVSAAYTQNRTGLVLFFNTLIG